MQPEVRAEEEATGLSQAIERMELKLLSTIQDHLDPACRDAKG